MKTINFHIGVFRAPLTLLLPITIYLVNSYALDIPGDVNISGDAVIEGNIDIIGNQITAGDANGHYGVGLFYTDNITAQQGTFEQHLFRGNSTWQWLRGENNILAMSLSSQHELSLWSSNGSTPLIILRPDGQSEITGNLRVGGTITLGNNTQASGTNAIAFGSQTQASGSNSTALGYKSIASGVRALAAGNQTSATARNAFAFGNMTEAIANEATAFGSGAIASGQMSTAFGDRTQAQGVRSTALGYATISAGPISLAAGIKTRTIGFGQASFGAFNFERVSSMNSYHMGNDLITVNNPDETLFVVGNGTSESTRSNALRVNWRGDLEAGGNVTATGATYRGPVRLAPAGDIPMGVFTEGENPSTASTQ